MKFRARFYGVRAGAIYPVWFEPGDDCPPELEEAAIATGAVKGKGRKSGPEGGPGDGAGAPDGDETGADDRGGDGGGDGGGQDGEGGAAE